MKESSIVVYKTIVIAKSIGTAGTVEFDFDTLWHYAKIDALDTSNISKLYFYHVHPKGFLELSTTDINCIQGFIMALGKSIIFSIITFEKDELDNIEYYMKSFLCENKSTGTNIKNIIDCGYQDENIFLNKTQVKLLKNLSYSELTYEK